MNLLVTIPSLEIGGAEIFLVRLLNYLGAEKNLRLFVLDFEKEKRDAALIQTFSDKITLLDNPLGHPFLKKLLGKLERVLKLEPDTLSYRFYTSFLKRTIRKHKITLIHSHLYRSDRIIARCVSGITTVTTLHGCYNFFGQDRSEELFRVLSTFKAIVYIAERNLVPLETLQTKEVLLGKTLKIYNGLQLPASLASLKQTAAGEVHRVVIVSRCIREKGWDHVIAAVKRLHAEQLPIELDLVGDGEYLETLKQKHAQDQFIFFSGKVIDVNAHIAKADICCFPSVYPNESLPNSILEYMMNRKPIITNRIGEVEQMVTTSDGTLCAVLAPKDATGEELVSFYAREIKALVNDPARCARLSELAGETVKKFDLRHSAAAYLELYSNFKEKI